MLLGVSDAICLQLRSFTRVCLGIIVIAIIAIIVTISIASSPGNWA